MMLLLLMNIIKNYAYFYFIINAYFNLNNFTMYRPYVFFYSYCMPCNNYCIEYFINKKNKKNRNISTFKLNISSCKLNILSCELNISTFKVYIYRVVNSIYRVVKSIY